ncbi:MAG TPA: CaiB/BaiF CoA-transferase family protein [Terriglobales bacterium]|jgi:crotonobetainyl-CoA:carnitine CoA-transferase CaiB-like acyl-CoA transferase|nr:CaiB/BaiF CoA-transferase family protein [Terriglobales bacterium]
MSAPDPSLPLSGLCVVALEQAVAGPFCSRQLADMGADVIKIERPDGGDFARQYDGVLHGLSAYFAWLNRGKRSVTLNLKDERDHSACLKLIQRADVFVHNLAPGAVDRLGFGYDQLAPRCQRLIWCGISGYGPDGPYHHKKAYDFLIQAESGVVSLTGTPGSPAKVGISIADIASGLYGYSSVLAALLSRERTGHGERIDISMLECLTEWTMPALYAWSGTGNIPARAGMRHNMIVPYGAYTCADGMVNLAIQNKREWRRFCSVVLDVTALADDPRFAANADRLRNRTELEALIEEHFRKYSKAEILARLDEANIANGAVNDIPAVRQHPQHAARKRWMNAASPAGTIPAFVPPHNLMTAPAHIGAVPALGEHTQEVLAELDEGEP